MRKRKSVILIIFIGAFFLSLLFLSPYIKREEPSVGVSHSTYSDRPNGTMALYLLLEDLGYDVRRIESPLSRLEEEVRALFIVQPHDALGEDEVEKVSDWVRKGGFLVISGVGDKAGLGGLLKGFGVKPVRSKWQVESPNLALSFRNPPVGRIISKTDWSLDPLRSDVEPLFGREEAYTLVKVRSGEGTVFILSSPYPLTNEGLLHEDNARFLSNLLSFIPQGSAVGFDEYHHGFRRVPFPVGDEITPVLSFLKTPLGRALSYVGVALLLFLILNGRRLGRPILTEEVSRRDSSEYVISMAMLYRKAEKRTAVLRHIRDEFRRKLARRWGLDPEMGSSEFAKTLAGTGKINAERLESLLNDLDREDNLSEESLLRLAQRVEEYIVEV
jgi:hypothetical protein